LPHKQHSIFPETGEHLTFLKCAQGYRFYETRDGRKIIGSNEVSICKDDKLIFDSGNSFQTRINAIHEDENGTIWIGSLRGLFYLKDNALAQFSRVSELSKLRITCIASLQKHLLVGTGTDGLYIVGSDTVFHLEQTSGLGSNMIRCMYVDNDSTVWVGTNKGLTKYYLSISDSLNFHYNRFTSGDGLPTGIVNDIIKHRDLIWLGTDKGMVSFDPERIRPVNLPPRILVA